MKLLLNWIVAFFLSAQTVKNQSWLHSYEWYISFLQHFVRYSLKVCQLCFSHCRAWKTFCWLDPSGSHLLYVSPCYLFTLFLSAHALFDIRHIIIKHSRDSKSYFAHFFDLIAHYFSLFTLFPSIFFFPS